MKAEKLKVIKPLDPKRQSNHKFCLFVRGGLGDSIRRYLGEGIGGDGWEYIQPLKEKYPDSIIKLITFSANEQTPHLHKYNPYIDEIYQHKWRHPRHACPIVNKLKGKDYELIKLANAKPNLEVVGGLTPVKQHEFYLSQEDKTLVEHMAYVGPYVVLHPFSGGSSRKIMPTEEYYPLVNAIINRGLSVIIVGANWKKPTTFYPGHNVKEEFNHRQPGLINLIDKANPRVVIELVKRSTCLISVRSYCFASTKSGKVNSILIISHPKSKSKTYFTPKENEANMLEPFYGWTREIIDNRIRMVGGDYDYAESRRSILNHLDNFLKERRNAKTS